MTATLPDRDAHAGAAADAARARSRELADDAAWVTAQHAPARQVDGIARDLRDYRTTDGARVVPTWEPEHGDLDVRAQVDWLIEDHERLAQEVAAVTAALDEAGVSTHDPDGRRYTLAERVQVGVFRVAVQAKREVAA